MGRAGVQKGQEGSLVEGVKLCLARKGVFVYEVDERRLLGLERNKLGFSVRGE